MLNVTNDLPFSSYEEDKDWFNNKAADGWYQVASSAGANLPHSVLWATDTATLVTSVAVRSLLKFPCWLTFKTYDLGRRLFAESPSSKYCSEDVSCASWVKGGHNLLEKSIVAVENGEYALTSTLRTAMTRSNERLTDLIFGEKAKDSFTLGELLSAALVAGGCAYSAYHIGKQAWDNWKIVILGKKVYTDRINDLESGTRINYELTEKFSRSAAFGHAFITTVAAGGMTCFSIIILHGMENRLSELGVELEKSKTAGQVNPSK